MGPSARLTDANGRSLCVPFRLVLVHDLFGEPLHTFPDHAFDRPNTRIRLLAGISAISVSARPELAASFSRSAVSRTPHSALLSRRLVSNTALLTAVCLPSRLNGPYRNSRPSGRKVRPAPATRPSATRHGAIWMTLAQNTASNLPGPRPSCISGHHAGSDRSIRSGGRIFDNPEWSRHAAMLLRCRSFKSLGHQVIPGVCRAKSTTCWPVPLPASTTSPDFPARKP